MYNVSLAVMLGRVIGLIIGFTLHEFAHAWTAYRLGDHTAYRQGRLTLDPRSHIDPIGIVLALVAGFGWARPVPVNPRAFYPNEQRGLVIVSLAGPLTNLLIAVVLGAFIQLAGVTSGFFYSVLGTVVIFNLALFLFNLLPFSPLDGFKIAVGVLPEQQSRDLARRERDTAILLVLLLMLGAVTRGQFDILWPVLGPPLRFLYSTVTGIGF